MGGVYYKNPEPQETDSDILQLYQPLIDYIMKHLDHEKQNESRYYMEGVLIVDDRLRCVEAGVPFSKSDRYVREQWNFAFDNYYKSFDDSTAHGSADIRNRDIMLGIMKVCEKRARELNEYGEFDVKRRQKKIDFLIENYPDETLKFVDMRDSLL